MLYEILNKLMDIGSTIYRFAFRNIGTLIVIGMIVGFAIELNFIAAAMMLVGYLWAIGQLN
jgi:hypothetical protein